MTWSLHSSLQSLVDEAQRSADRRMTRRIALPLRARFLTMDKKEHRARILNISPYGALVRALPGTKQGEKIILYVDKIGRFTGEIIRIERDGFAIKFDQNKKRARRIADMLTWLVNDGEESFNRRRAQRIKQNKNAIAVLEDARNVPCRILDISMTGASLAIKPRPAIGQKITVGRMQAIVMRHHENGVGVKFTAPRQKQNKLEGNSDNVVNG